VAQLLLEAVPAGKKQWLPLGNFAHENQQHQTHAIEQCRARKPAAPNTRLNSVAHENQQHQTHAIEQYHSY
jgi:hypothetical protein